MPVLSGEETSIGMIRQVVLRDGQVWEQFSANCQRMISGWCRNWNLSSADCDDVTQESLLVVLVKVHTFRRLGCGSFRAWLKAIAWRCRCELVARADSRQRLEAIAFRLQQTSEEIAILEAEFERLYRMEQLERCLLSVRQRVTRETWLAFEKHALEGLPAPRVASELGASVKAVYAARVRVLSMLREEWRHL